MTKAWCMYEIHHPLNRGWNMSITRVGFFILAVLCNTWQRGPDNWVTAFRKTKARRRSRPVVEDDRKALDAAAKINPSKRESARNVGHLHVTSSLSRVSQEASFSIQQPWVAILRSCCGWVLRWTANKNTTTKAMLVVQIVFQGVSNVWVCEWYGSSKFVFHWREKNYAICEWSLSNNSFRNEESLTF